MPIFIIREGVVDRFRNSFIEIDGRSYFHVNGAEFLLPVSDAQLSELIETFRFRHGIAMVLTWIIWPGALCWWYVWFVAGGRAQGWWILGGGFLATCLIHLAVWMSTTWRLRSFIRKVRKGQLPRPPDAIPVPDYDPDLPDWPDEDR